ncbi:MAG: FkbM family methyltransferase [Clostridia bacterium]|nr:FkbM family methyltransferase [Clostridia bacterium]
MIEKIIEQNVWDVLKSTPLPIVIYGMGNGADMVIDKLQSMGVDFADIFASDKFVRGQFFRGKQVLKYSDVCEKYYNFFIVMSFAVHDDETIENVLRMSKEHPLVAPDVPVADDSIFTREFIEEHDEEFNKAYSLLADDESRENYINILNFKVSGKIEYLLKAEKEKRFIYDKILKISDEEIFVDLGAYDGDTIREFIDACQGKYKKIYAFEADEKNFKKLTINTKEQKNVSIYNLAAWDKKETLLFEKKKGRNSKLSSAGNVEVQANSVDNVIDEKITVLKMDIEGSEEKALDGARGMIVKYKPKLYVCAYHRNSDMFLLPLKINSFCKDYGFYFYHHRYIPAWESNFYGVVK